MSESTIDREEARTGAVRATRGFRLFLHVLVNTALANVTTSFL
ncbi:hypothetical protein [Gulosibacter chungangensis]|nr:hypothetical protein [Gulosibacter chungangensis]